MGWAGGIISRREPTTGDPGAVIVTGSWGGKIRYAGEGVSGIKVWEGLQKLSFEAE